MNLKSIVETILFVRAEPTDIKMLARLTKRSIHEIRITLKELMQDYAQHGIVLLEKDDSWQMGTNPMNAQYIEDITKDEFNQELSRSSLETLAIIAYKGPISRFDIEYLRGVHSSFTIRNLLMRGLIERIENPKDARSYLYCVSFDFLKHFGLTHLEQLPKFEEFTKQKIEIAEEKSNGVLQNTSSHPPDDIKKQE